MLNTILSVVFIIDCVFLTGVVLFQEGNSQGLGAVSGMADSYWGRNKGRSLEGTLTKLTTVGAVLFVVLAIVLNLV